MKIAMALFEYFPYGGLQRDFLGVATRLRDDGHEVAIFVSEWIGDMPSGVRFQRIRRHGFSNHARSLSFSRQFEAQTRTGYDVRLGFNRMRGLDFYFAADPCYAAWHGQEWWKRWIPRYRAYLALEQELAESSQTRLFYLSPQQKLDYQTSYHIEDARFIQVPPGIDRRFRPDQPKAAHWRAHHRGELGLSGSDRVLLQVGSNFRLKGVGKSLLALAALPEELRRCCQLLVVGQDDARPFKKLASKLGIAERVHFLGARDDVHELMAASDLLLHPSEYESAGMVLVEAIASGIPVIVTGTCGYAFHVRDAEMGAVLSSPFEQQVLNESLKACLQTWEQVDWRHRAQRYVGRVDLYGLAETMVRVIEAG